MRCGCVRTPWSTRSTSTASRLLKRRLSLGTACHLPGGAAPLVECPTAAVDVASLASSFERAQAEAMVELSTVARPVADGWMTFGGAGAFVNKACGLGLSGEVPEDTARLISAFFQGRGVTPQVEVCPFVHPSLLKALDGAGFHLRELEHVLVAELEEADASRPRGQPPGPEGLPEGLVVERISSTDARAVEAYVHVSASGFVKEGETLPAAFLAASLKAPHLVGYDCYLARLDGQVVGAGGCATRRRLTAPLRDVGASRLPQTWHPPGPHRRAARARPRARKRPGHHRLASRAAHRAQRGPPRLPHGLCPRSARPAAFGRARGALRGQKRALHFAGGGGRACVSWKRLKSMRRVPSGSTVMMSTKRWLKRISSAT